MHPPSDAPTGELARLRRKVLGDACGHIVARAVHLAAELRLAEQLEAGARSAEELARDKRYHETSLYRLLHFLGQQGYLEELPGRRFVLTPLGAMLRADAPGNVAAVIAQLGHPAMWRAYAELDAVLRTGLPPEQRRGRDLYRRDSDFPHEEVLAEAMIGYHAPEPPLVAARYDFGASKKVVDVGGSSGRLLTTILAAHPHLTGLIFDRPGIEGEARVRIAAAGLEKRCDFAGGSFFDAVPDGGDTYILSHILHDWSDAEAVNILRACRRAMGDAGKLLIIEAVLSPGAAEQPELPFDMLLLANTEGRLRTVDEYAALLAEADLRLSGRVECGAAVTVLEAAPAPAPAPRAGLLKGLAALRGR